MLNVAKDTEEHGHAVLTPERVHMSNRFVNDLRNVLFHQGINALADEVGDSSGISHRDRGNVRLGSARHALSSAQPCASGDGQVPKGLGSPMDVIDAGSALVCPRYRLACDSMWGSRGSVFPPRGPGGGRRIPLPRQRRARGKDRRSQELSVCAVILDALIAAGDRSARASVGTGGQRECARDRQSGAAERDTMRRHGAMAPSGIDRPGPRPVQLGVCYRGVRQVRACTRRAARGSEGRADRLDRGP